MFRRINKRKKGFTLVETFIAIGMATGLIILVLKMFTLLRGNVAKGTVDLQNLQDARAVINSLRRDYSCAIPSYGNDTRDNIAMVKADPIWSNSDWNSANHPSGTTVARPVIFSDSDIEFCKKVINPDGSVGVERIQYAFDSVSKTLNRISSPSGKRQTFKGIESIKFDLYYHPSNEIIPMLLVTMNIQTTESNQTRVLPLTTTLSSNIIPSELENLDWNWIE